MGNESTLEALRHRHEQLQNGTVNRLPRPQPAIIVTTKKFARKGQPAVALDEARALGQFTIESLTIACWQANPYLFGLTGYETYHPDVRRVACLMFGRRGFVRRGLVEKVDDGVYRAAEKD